MDVLVKFLRDKSNNNLVVAVILAFSTVNFIQTVVSFWDAGPGDYWVGSMTRALVTFALTILVAWGIAKAAK